MLFLTWIGDAVTGGLRELILLIASLVYSILSAFGNMFYKFVLLTDLDLSSSVADIYRRVGLLLALFMLFKLTFSFIQYLLNPDQISDSQKGIKKIIYRFIIAILLLATTPFLFSKAFELQSAIFEKDDNVIKRIVLGDSDEYTQNFGSEFSYSLFASFADEGKQEQMENELLLDDADSQIIDQNGPNDYISNLGMAFLALLMGIGACWVFFMYTVSLALRIIQLFFLEIIAPVPIMASISSSKENPLEKWGKQCLTTYVDVFIRVFVMYVAIFLIRVISSTNFLNKLSSSEGFLVSLIIKVILIWAVLLFTQKAADLIKEMFPGAGSKAAGDFGFGWKSRSESPFNLVNRGLGVATVGAMSVQRNMRKGIGKTGEKLREALSLPSASSLTRGAGESIEQFNKRKQEAAAAKKSAFKDVGKWAWRATGGAVLGGGVAGMRRGFKTTSHSGRMSAAANAYSSTQSKYKVADAGYSVSQKAQDLFKGVWDQDKNIGDLTILSDAKIRGLRNAITDIETSDKYQVLQSGYSVTSSKVNGDYILMDAKGNMVKRGNTADIESYFTSVNFKDASDAAKWVTDLADMSALLGKAEGQNKALHQKENESKKE